MEERERDEHAAAAHPCRARYPVGGLMGGELKCLVISAFSLKMFKELGPASLLPVPNDRGVGGTPKPHPIQAAPEGAEAFGQVNIHIQR